MDEEVHLHGYDVAMDVAAGGKVEFDVPATIDGVFEVELEDRVVPLAEITVTPGSWTRRARAGSCSSATRWSAARTCRSRNGCSHGARRWS